MSVNTAIESPARAGRLTRIGGRHVLRVAHNPASEAVYASIDERLAV